MPVAPVRDRFGAPQSFLMTTPTKPAPAIRTGSPRSPADGRLAASIDAWKRKLLDLSKRNRALNFRATKVSTVAIVDEHPAEIFRLLYLAEREMRFKATEPAAPDAGTSAPTSADGRPDERVRPERHRSRRSCRTTPRRSTTGTPTSSCRPPRPRRRSTARSADSTSRRGSRSRSRASTRCSSRSACCTTPRPTHRTRRSRRRSCCFRCELSRKSARSGYRIRAADDEPVVNPALAEYLRLDFGIHAPGVARLGHDRRRLRSADAPVQRVAARRGTPRLVDYDRRRAGAVLVPEARDVQGPRGERTRGRGASTRAGSSCGQEGERVIGLPDDVRRLDLDGEFAPEATAQVVDADSQPAPRDSRRRRADTTSCSRVRREQAKSQTITNLIAQALGAGKSRAVRGRKDGGARRRAFPAREGAGSASSASSCIRPRRASATVMRSLAAAIDASLAASERRHAGWCRAARRAHGAQRLRASAARAARHARHDAVRGVRRARSGSRRRPTLRASSTAHDATSACAVRATRRRRHARSARLDGAGAARARRSGARCRAIRPGIRGATRRRRFYTEDDVATVREVATELGDADRGCASPGSRGAERRSACRRSQRWTTSTPRTASRR